MAAVVIIEVECQPFQEQRAKRERLRFDHLRELGFLERKKHIFTPQNLAQSDVVLGFLLCFFLTSK